MRSSGEAATGRQEPQVRVEPARAYSDGADAAELVAAYGYDLDPWQRLVLDSWLGRTAEDLYAAESCGLAVPRQNGKNALLEARELYGVLTAGERILHTAHEVKTARKAFLRLASFFENERRYPELAAEVKFIRRTNGQEAIELLNGGSVEFSARSKNAARGYTVDVVVFDEAQALNDEQVEAIVPTLAAAPHGNRQFIYTGTPPAPSMMGEVFRRARAVAHEGRDPTAAWHEWAAGEVGDPADKARWYATNPALGIRITEAFVRKESLTMSPDGFARERLGWWSEARALGGVDPALWARQAVGAGEAPREGRKAFGVKFSPDGQAVALAACRLSKGRAHVELVRTATMADGAAWVAEGLEGAAPTTSAVAVDGRSGAGWLLDRLRGAYPAAALMTPGAGGVCAAASMVEQGLRDGTLTHLAGQEALDRSAAASVRRRVGADGGWTFGGEDSLPMEACALALWAAKRTRRDPTRRTRLL